ATLSSPHHTGDYLGLPSFPTRRSSDLPCELGIGGFGQRSAHDLRGQHGCPSLIGARTATGTAGRPASPPRRRGIRLRQRRSPTQDRKSTRLNSSHVAISYAVFCLKKNK